MVKLFGIESSNVLVVKENNLVLINSLELIRESDSNNIVTDGIPFVPKRRSKQKPGGGKFSIRLEGSLGKISLLTSLPYCCNGCQGRVRAVSSVCDGVTRILATGRGICAKSKLISR